MKSAIRLRLGGLLLDKVLIIGLLLAAIATPGAAGEGDGPDLETLVREQGETIEKLKQEVERLRDKDAVTLDTAVEQYLSATEPEMRERLPSSVGGTPMYGQRVRVGGYFTIEFRDNGDGSAWAFDQHRLVPKIQADVAEGITFETEIEIEGGGADVDFLTGNEILVEYAELGFQILEDKLNFVAGAILLPWGRYNLYHDDPLSDLTDRPLVSRYIGSVAAQQAGVAVDGSLDVGNGWFLDYDVAVVQGFHDGFSTANGVRDARPSFRADNNDNKQVFGRVVATPPLSFVDVLQFGTSFTYGEWDAGSDLADYGWGVDLYIKRGRLRFTGEYMWLRIEQPGTALPTDPGKQSGWYAELAYDFFPATWRGQHILLTQESTFTLVVRVEGLDLNHGTEGTVLRDDITQVTIGFCFRPVQRTVFKVSYTFVDSELTGFDGGSADVIALSWSTYF
jgi:hypothetical protein